MKMNEYLLTGKGWNTHFNGKKRQMLLVGRYSTANLHNRKSTIAGDDF